MFDLKHRMVEANGIRIHIAEQGEGPLVLLCHGFPETWYSWRHQLSALAECGFRAVAPDMRGYCETESPEAIEEYSLLHLMGAEASLHLSASLKEELPLLISTKGVSLCQIPTCLY
jgi:pimeloyl-ACP methyl ester carboxylesterase